ncbi:hypothetical protein T492DRAFT_845314 [Pavlovales sp. CCMP2436]|nr:hypothetical protein T492DRAFT_845314 [Pavlovales sp. CCMP2436]
MWTRQLSTSPRGVSTRQTPTVSPAVVGLMSALRKWARAASPPPTFFPRVRESPGETRRVRGSPGGPPGVRGSPGGPPGVRESPGAVRTPRAYDSENPGDEIKAQLSLPSTHEDVTPRSEPASRGGLQVHGAGVDAREKYASYPLREGALRLPWRAVRINSVDTRRRALWNIAVATPDYGMATRECGRERRARRMERRTRLAAGVHALSSRTHSSSRAQAHR